MSNPDIPRPYWQDPARAGSDAGAWRSRATDDPYQRSAGRGGSAGYERQARAGRGSQGRDGGRGTEPGRPAQPTDARDGWDRQWYSGEAGQGRGNPPEPDRRSPRDPRDRSPRDRSPRGRGARGRGARGPRVRDEQVGQDPQDIAAQPVSSGPRYRPQPRGVQRELRDVQPELRGIPPQSRGVQPQLRGIPPQPPGARPVVRDLGDGRAAQDVSDRQGVRTGPRARTQTAPRERRDSRAGAGDPVAFDSYGAPTGYGSTLQREHADGLRVLPRPGDGQRGPGGRRGGRGGGYGGGPGDGGPGQGGRGFRHWLLHGSWWRHWTWKKALAIVAGLIVAMMLAVVAVVVYVYNKTEIPTAVSEAALQQSSTVYFSNGTTRVGTFSANDIHRQLLSSSQIPQDVKNAVIAAEDRHFYTEGGISPTGILRAAYQDATGGTFQGGSTITQQFVRNYYTTIGTDQTVSRKIKEIFVAIKLSHEKSKDWILTNYLNTVFLGDTAYGVGAAAQIYFNEQASQLTVAQAAMLAAMINQPGYFDPDPNGGPAHAALVTRWKYVLSGMVSDGALTQAQASAQKFPAVMHGQVLNGSTGYRGYIMEAVQNELESLYGYKLQQIDSLGLRIVTTFNVSMMNTLYRTVSEAKQQMLADGQPLPYWAHVGVVLEKPGSGAILAMYGGPGTSVRRCLKLKCQLNMALESRNQVGSSFKPYVLATAVHQNMNAQTSLLDGYQSICSPSDAFPKVPSLTIGGTTCPPSQYGYFNFNSFGESNGPVSVAKASALSLNTAYGDLIHRVGTQNVINMAAQFGVNTGPYPAGSNLQKDLGDSTIALGQASLTVAEQATTFATLADGGMYYTPHVIAKITQNGATVPSRVRHHQVLTPTQAADVDWALSFDTIYGTAVPNAVLSPYRPTIAKTGTTDVAQDAFFIGAIPQYSLAVGMFTNSQTQSPSATQTLNVLPTINGQAGGYGGAWPATIWRLYMTNEFAQLPVQQLLTPNFNGFDKWVQAAQKPKQKRPNPGPTCGPRHGHGHGFGQPCPPPSPGPTLTPSPTPTPTFTPTPTPTPTITVSPSPSCSHPVGGFCPPSPPGPNSADAASASGQGGHTTSAGPAQAAEDPAVTSARRPRSLAAT